MKQEYSVNIKYDDLLDISYITHNKQRLLSEFLIDYPFTKKYTLKWKIDSHGIIMIDNVRYVTLSLIVKIK